MLAELALALAPCLGLARDSDDPPCHHPIDEHECTRHRQLNDRAEPFEPCAARRMLAVRAYPIDDNANGIARASEQSAEHVATLAHSVRMRRYRALISW
jgi:hypothetical protein